jgi:hypothetical protein
MTAQTFDVVVLGFRSSGTETAGAAIARIVGITPEEGDALIRNAPRVVLGRAEYSAAEACAASLGLAGAEVTVVPHPFVIDSPANLASDSDPKPLSFRSTAPGPSPEELVVNAPPAAAMPVMAEAMRSDPPLGYRATEPDSAHRQAMHDAHSAPRESHGPERSSRVMGVLSIKPGRSMGLRYAGLLAFIAAMYAVWVFLLDRL